MTFSDTSQTLFSFWYRINYVIKKTEGVVGRGLGWHELGMDPNRWPLSQFHPKIPMIRRCSTILPAFMQCHICSLNNVSLYDAGRSGWSLCKITPSNGVHLITIG